jgi:hypothetical protein
MRVMMQVLQMLLLLLGVSQSLQQTMQQHLQTAPRLLSHQTSKTLMTRTSKSLTNHQMKTSRL